MVRLSNLEIEKKGRRDKLKYDEDHGIFVLHRNIRVVSAMIVLNMTLMTSFGALILRLTVLTRIS